LNRKTGPGEWPGKALNPKIQRKAGEAHRAQSNIFSLKVKHRFAPVLCRWQQGVLSIPPLLVTKKY